jgi:hypothetical protein
MSEIRSALVEATTRVQTALPPNAELIHLLSLSNPHPEEDPTNGQEVTIVDLHGYEISFGLPIEQLDVLRQTSLRTRLGQFLVIDGRDINGTRRTYCLEISDRLISQLAFQLYAVLAAARGNEFARDHIFDWQSWMR